jgi:hypothetical protein
MNPVLIIVAITILVLFVIPGIVLMIFWFKSYNRRAIIFRELGENPNDSKITIVKCKVQKHGKLGEVTRYMMGSGLTLSKRFSSDKWTKIFIKGRLWDGILLYQEGQNLRPLKIMQDVDGLKLEAIDEDNEDFLINSAIYRAEKNDESRIIVISVVCLFIFLVVLSSFYVGSHIYITDMTLNRFTTDYLMAHNYTGGFING